jgi:hypothetical protein
MALHLYNKHTDKDCIQAIRSLHPAGGLQHRGDAAPTPIRDRTTWLSRGLRGRYDAAEDPHAEEEARALCCIERGAFILVASDRGGSTSPSQMKCR